MAPLTNAKIRACCTSTKHCDTIKPSEIVTDQEHSFAISTRQHPDPVRKAMSVPAAAFQARGC